MNKKRKPTTQKEAFFGEAEPSSLTCEQIADKLNDGIQAYKTLLAKEHGGKYASLAIFCLKGAVENAFGNAVAHNMHPGKAVACTLALCAAADRISDHLCGTDNTNQKN